MRLCKNALQHWKIGIIFHILTSQSTNLFLKENVLCARLWILIHFDGNKEASENFKFLCSIVFEICVCVLEIFQKLYLKKYLIYKAKISHQSVHIIKLWTMKFICKLVTAEQKMVRNLMIWNQITQETVGDES